MQSEIASLGRIMNATSNNTIKNTKTQKVKQTASTRHIFFILSRVLSPLVLYLVPRFQHAVPLWERPWSPANNKRCHTKPRETQTLISPNLYEKTNKDLPNTYKFNPQPWSCNHLPNSSMSGEHWPASEAVSRATHLQ